ncbi:MAG: glycosyltransferase family 4 protein [Halioglobus sp.]|nr:glycosyltransferase family 4 protein [Halioglobus sp.]
MRILFFANTDWYLYNFRLSLFKALRDSSHDVLLISPPGPYGKKLQELGFDWIPAPMDRRSLNPLKELALVWWLIRLMRSRSVTVVHGFTIKCALYAAISARLTRVPARVSAVTGMGYVYTSRDGKAKLLQPLVSMLMKLALGGKNSRLILQNQDDFDFFEKNHLVDAEQIRLIRSSGVNCSAYAPKSHHHVDHAKLQNLTVLLAARMLWDKGIKEYVAAARILLAEGRDIEFILAGDPDLGNPASVPEDCLRSWEQEGIVRWIGHSDNMPSLLRGIDIFVLPSYREGLPKGLIEAGACGLPLVTTDAPGCREVVTNGVEGLIVPVESIGLLAEAIARLHDDVPMRKQCGIAARAKVLSEFDERIVISRTMDVYEELLNDQIL